MGVLPVRILSGGCPVSHSVGAYLERSKQYEQEFPDHPEPHISNRALLVDTGFLEYGVRPQGRQPPVGGLLGIVRKLQYRKDASQGTAGKRYVHILGAAARPRLAD